jgi:pimeloyl-ACP methyl ester carboxylesterase
MPIEISHHATQANGIRLHYAQAGAGALMLFLHGFPEFWYAWRRQLEEFGRDHLAVAPDLRGYNLSDRPPEVKAYRANVLIEDVRQLAAQLTDQPFILVAHDWGGALAWTFAIAHPERLKALVIINAPHPVPFARDLAADPAQQQASRYMNLFRDPKAERVLSENNHARLLRMMSSEWGHAGFSDADREAYVAAWSQEGALTGMLNYYRASPLYPPIGDDPGAGRVRLDPTQFMVQVPTLVIWGERDGALLPGNLRGLEAYVPDLTVKRIPEGSHWVINERPDEVNALIRAFLSR